MGGPPGAATLAASTPEDSAHCGPGAIQAPCSSWRGPHNLVVCANLRASWKCVCFCDNGESPWPLSCPQLCLGVPPRTFPGARCHWPLLIWPPTPSVLAWEPERPMMAEEAETEHSWRPVGGRKHLLWFLKLPPLCWWSPWGHGRLRQGHTARPSGVCCCIVDFPVWGQASLFLFV